MGGAKVTVENPDWPGSKMTATEKQQFAQKWLSLVAPFERQPTAPDLAQVRAFLIPYLGDFNACFLDLLFESCGDASKAGSQCKDQFGHDFNLLTWADEKQMLINQIKQMNWLASKQIEAWTKCRMFDTDDPTGADDMSTFEEFQEFTLDPATDAAAKAAEALKPVGIGAVALIALGVVVYAATR